MSDNFCLSSCFIKLTIVIKLIKYFNAFVAANSRRRQQEDDEVEFHTARIFIYSAASTVSLSTVLLITISVYAIFHAIQPLRSVIRKL